MRIVSVSIEDYRGVTATIPLAGAVVLFGPNDAGKTNILDAIESGLTKEVPARVDRHRDRHPAAADIELEVELPGLDVQGSADREFFYRWTRDPQDWDWLFSTEDGASEELIDEIKRRLGDHFADFPSIIDERRPERVDAFIADFKDALRTYDTACDMWSEELFASRRFVIGAGSVSWGTGRFPRAIGWEQEPLARVVRHQPDTWAALEEDILALLRINWGEVVGIADRLDDAAPFLHRERLGKPGWLERRDEWVRVHPDVVEACARIGEEATELAPAFVRERYRIVVVPTSPVAWREHGGRISVRVVPRSSREDDEGFDLRVASSGVATWVGYAVAEAIRRRRAARASSSEDLRSGALPTIYLIDEPESHLHPLAQEQAAEWLADVARGGAWVVVATHAVPFLRFPLEEDVEYAKVLRGPDWTTHAQPISHAVLSEVQESARELGLPPAALIQLVRGWLVVEGDDDKKVLERLFGERLRRAGIVTLCLRGYSRLKASFLNLQALNGLGIPFFLLIDNTRQEAIRTSKPARPRSDEEHSIAELRALYRDKKERVHLLPFPWPDILCALPEQAVNAVCKASVARAPFPGWAELVGRYDPRTTHKGQNFKAFALDYLGVDGLTNATALIDAALDRWDGDLSSDHPLRKPIDDMLDGTALAL